MLVSLALASHRVLVGQCAGGVCQSVCEVLLVTLSFGHVLLLPRSSRQETRINSSLRGKRASRKKMLTTCFSRFSRFPLKLKANQFQLKTTHGSHE